MEIYFSPEVITPQFQILNVVNGQEKALGNVALLFDEKNFMYTGYWKKKE
ncbi:hypothetical protein NSQ82_10135 [Caldifermentibacillus hisashii]